MNDVCIYKILVRGRVEEEELNAQSPQRLVVEQAGSDSSTITILTDQSGLIGLLRHLHGLGIVFLSMQLEPLETTK